MSETQTDLQPDQPIPGYDAVLTEVEQKGQERADYGTQLLKPLPKAPIR
jgi:hypothetical protein